MNSFICKSLDKMVQYCSVITALAMALLMLSIFFFIAGESLPLWTAHGIKAIIFGIDWKPLGTPPQTGLLIMISSTLLSAIGAMLIAAPVGICCAVFLSEFSPAWLSLILRPVIHLITGIPSVVYGFLGAAILVRYFEVTFAVSSGESLFCASLVLSIMVIPYIVTGCYTALRSISDDYRTAALAMSISKPYLILKVLLPMARRSMINSIALAFGRAAGETMAVIMLAGNTLSLPESWFSKGEPLSALIALELGSAEAGSIQYQGIFAAGLVLLLFVSVLNLAIYTAGMASQSEGKTNV